MKPEPILDDVEKRMLDRIQSEFPLDEDPYGRLAEALGLTRERARRAINRLRRIGVIRRIGGCYVPARLGYLTTLVGAEVAPERIEGAAAQASRFPMVTHNYQRDARLNLWFTVIAPSRRHLRDVVSCVAAADGVREIHALPSVRTFKLWVDFAFGKPGRCARRNAHSADAGGGACALDALDRRLIARACGDIGTGLAPYDEIAEELDAPREEVLKRLRGYARRGAMRRFGAVLRHREAGFVANGMAVWNVPEGRVDAVGARLSACPDISHCYERVRAPGWPYNVYAMVHGQDASKVKGIARALARETGMDDYRILFSSREFKKTSMAYFASPSPAPAPDAAMRLACDFRDGGRA